MTALYSASPLSLSFRRTCLAKYAMAESSVSKSDEEMEEMLDRMLTRLALCEDSKLQFLLSKLLPVSISSLSSKSINVRNKVLEILSHVNKRVKHRPDISLPLAELWNLYLEANSALMVRNFCIVYIEMAFDRIHGKEKENMALILVANISKLPSLHQEIILRIVIKVIGLSYSSQVDDEVSTKYKLANSPQELELFVEFCLHTILYQLQFQSGGCPPGLSIAQTKRVAGKESLNSDTLLLRKLGILNVIDGMDLPPEVVYPIYVAACVDSQEAVVKRGEELLKKKASGANLDDQRLINKLFTLFNGTVTENATPESKVNPGSPALKGKLMSIFCRSITAANCFPSTLQCIFDCIYGSGTTSKLKQMGMEFTVWVFKHANSDQLMLMGPVILNGILKSLDSDSNSASDAVARDTKTFAFQSIGLLALRMPQLFRDKIDMAVRLFEALKMETQSLRPIIQDSTNSLASAYKGAPETVLKDLEKLLLLNSLEEQNEVRFCAVRWATSVFDLEHCPSRYICMLAASDSILDIRDMALEGLFPFKDDGQNISQNLTFPCPKFEVMLTFILQQHPKLLDSVEMRETKLIVSSKTYVAIIKFLLICFEIELKQNNSVKVALNFQSSVEAMSSLLEHAMAFEGSAELHVCALKALITIGCYFPEMIASRYSQKILLLKQLLAHVDWDARESAALLLGIASSALPTLRSSALIEELLASISGLDKLRFESQHGTICAIGYVTADCVLKEPPISSTLYETVLKCLVDIVDRESATLASAAMQALGHIGLRVSLPPLINNSCSADILSILRETLNKLLLGDDMKAIQRILISIGHIGFKDPTPSCLNVALDLIFSLCRSKVEDILFAAGEALSFLWGAVPVTADVILKTNYTSLSTTSNFLMRDLNPSLFQYKLGETVETSEDFHAVVRDSITRKLFDVLLCSTRKEERCAGTVWLLSLTMYCGNHTTIQQMLPDIQDAFSLLLGEQNELTQELASQGMSIVYELGDASMKQNLVNALVSTLTGSGKKKRAIKLVEDSEVFQEGSIGQSISGGKLSTYKELCSLANEMGKPDLIYKFMDLANHQDSLNSKRGAAFGFSKVAKQAGDALKPHLHSLIPRLLRYQYDPDKNVQDAMTHIWKSLVADSKSTIDENYDLIINDLLTQCGSRLWRSREASCLALADIVQGRRFCQVGKYLRKIWSVAFRAMDDIKETVRISGEKLCRGLTSLTIRLCDVTLTEVADAREAMELVLPFLLAEGILSKVENIRKSSIGIVMKLAKGAGVAIRPHLSDLVCCMLEGLSSLEDQGLNYVELHAANIGIQKEKLENLRISIAKSSPMWETLDLCINVVDGESLNLLVPRLAQLVRSGVGLNTRVGVANFITLLVRKVGEEIKPYTNMLLRLLFPVVKEEKSASAKRAFAGACALVLKYAGHPQVQNLIEDSTALHAGDKNAQISCAILLKNYSSVASDIISGYQSLIIPVIFISRFEDDKIVSDLFEELWEETTSGERITIQLYLGEIVSLICESMGSTSWASKRRSAFAISKACEVLGESIYSYHQVLLQSLMKEIPGRLWEGKEALLHALGALSTSCHKSIHFADPATPKTILSLMSSATTKQDKKFREAALSCLEQVLKAFSNPEFFRIIFPLLFDMCNTFALNKSGQAPVASEAVKSGSDGVENSSISQVKTLNCLASSVHDAYIDDILDRQNDLVHVITTSLSLGFPWTVKTSTFSLIRELCSRFHEILSKCDGTSSPDRITPFVVELIHQGSPLVIQCISTIKIAQVHISASECLLEITQLYIRMPSANLTNVGFHAELLHQYEVEKNEVAKSLLRKSIENLEKPENAA